MKKAVRSLITLIMAAIMIFAIAVPASAQTKFEFDSDPDCIWEISVTVGREYTGFRDRVAEGYKLYSSDEEIMCIEEDGTLVAKSEGTAFIAEVFEGELGYYYGFHIKPSHNIVSSVYETTQDDIKFDTIKKEAEIEVMDILGPMIFFALVGTAVYIIVSTIYLSKTSVGKKKLPVLKETENTVKVAAADRTYCPKCGKEYGEASFCAECGISKCVKNQYVVPINKRITAQKFEKLINAWLAENPYIYNCKIKLNTRQSVFIPFVGYKFFIKNAVLEFNVADKPQNHQYGFAFLYKFRLFGPLGYNTDKHVAQWNKNNPDCKVISSHGGRIQHWDNKGGFYAQYYNYVFFKKG